MFFHLKVNQRHRLELINASHLHHSASVIIFIISVKSTENWSLAEFIQSYHRYSLLSDEAFWKTKASSKPLL